MTNKPRRIGRYIKSSAIAGETYYSYIPPPLRSLLPLNMAGLYPFLGQANIAIGRLDGMSATIRDSCHLSLPTILRSVSALESLDIVREITGRDRHTVFVYDRFLGFLQSGTEPRSS